MRFETSSGGARVADQHQRWQIVAATLVVSAAALYLVSVRCFNWPHNEDFLSIEWYRHWAAHDWSLSQWLAIRNGNHPLAFQAIFSSLMFEWLGIDFRAVMFASVAMLMAAALMLALKVAQQTEGGLQWIIGIGVPLILVHPMQTNHLLWAFEFGWFYITSQLIWNTLLIETGETRNLLLALGLGILAAFSSAHGFALWIAGALHILLRRPRHGAVFLALFLGALALNLIALSRMTNPGAQPLRLSDLPHFAVYCVQLFGMSFAIRGARTAFIAGTITLAATFALAVVRWPFRSSSAATRIGLVLMAASLCEITAFAFGRYQYGLAWVQAPMHSSPLLVPLLLGLLILGCEWTGSARGDALTRRLKAAAIPAFLCAGFLASVPYAIFKSRESQARAALAMHVSCPQPVDRYLVEHLNIAENFYDFIVANLPAIRHLCGQAEPAYVQRVEELPAAYVTLIERNPKLDGPLRDLWEVYQSHFDLQHAFAVDDSATPARLLEFARNDALQGSGYERTKLAAHAPLYEELVQTK